jgi:hypothetical protein
VQVPPNITTYSTTYCLQFEREQHKNLAKMIKTTRDLKKKILNLKKMRIPIPHSQKTKVKRLLKSSKKKTKTCNQLKNFNPNNLKV